MRTLPAGRLGLEGRRQGEGLDAGLGSAESSTLVNLAREEIFPVKIGELMMADPTEENTEAANAFSMAVMLRDKMYLDYLDELLDELGMTGWVVGESGPRMVYDTNNMDGIRTAVHKHLIAGAEETIVSSAKRNED